MTTGPSVDVCVWEPAGEGYVRLAYRKPVPKVLAEIVAVVGAEPYGASEYLTAHERGEWPEGQIAVFAVTGDNEGDYVHVEVLHGRKRTLAILGKTFDGRDAAWQFARQLADLLGA